MPPRTRRATCRCHDARAADPWCRRLWLPTGRFARPRPSMMMLAGLMSRCRTPSVVRSRETGAELARDFDRLVFRQPADAPQQRSLRRRHTPSTGSGADLRSGGAVASAFRRKTSTSRAPAAGGRPHPLKAGDTLFIDAVSIVCAGRMPGRHAVRLVIACSRRADAGRTHAAAGRAACAQRQDQGGIE